MRIRLCNSGMNNIIPLKMTKSDRPPIIDYLYLSNYKFVNGDRMCKIVITETSKYENNKTQKKYFVYLSDSYAYKDKCSYTVYLTRTKGLMSVDDFRRNISNQQDIIDSEFYFDCYDDIYDSILLIDNLIYQGEIIIG